MIMLKDWAPTIFFCLLAAAFPWRASVKVAVLSSIVLLASAGVAYSSGALGLASLLSVIAYGFLATGIILALVDYSRTAPVVSGSVGDSSMHVIDGESEGAHLRRGRIALLFSRLLRGRRS